MNRENWVRGKRMRNRCFDSFYGILILPVLMLTAACSLPNLSAQPALTTLNWFDLYDGRPAGLVLGSDGNFYEVTSGKVIRLTSSGALTRICILPNSGSMASLVQARNGYLYGTTTWGGSNGWGSVFKLSTTGDITELHSFANGNEGRYPMTKLVEAHDGHLYGTTDLGGTNDTGTIFRITTNGDFASLYSFTDNGRPRGLVEANDRYLYGTTINGGIGYGGSIFRISTNGVFANVHVFTGGPEGWQPASGVVQASDGCLYGTTSAGATYNYGSIFRLGNDGQLTVVHAFNYNEGTEPRAELVQTKDGALYGVAQTGGYSTPSSCGSIFRVTTNGAFSMIYSFTNGADGGQPRQALVQGPDGQLYGTTTGGSLGCQCGGATFFRLNITGQPFPPLLEVAITNQVLLLRWGSSIGARYQPQYSADLTSQQWTSLGPELTASTAVLSITDPVVNAPHRVYRVLLLP